MMINAYQDIRQDTIRITKTVSASTVRLKTDSITHAGIVTPAGTRMVQTKPVSRSPEIVQTDTTSVCIRNNIADITFYDSVNFITTLDHSLASRFPVSFIEKNSLREAETRATLVRQLKPGQTLPEQPLSNDWAILIILISAFLYSLIRSTTKSLLPEISRFFLFRGIKESLSRDSGGMFLWQSTILNLVSFFAFSLFGYYAADVYNLIPRGTSSLMLWLIFTGIVIVAVVLRHLTCITTGIISGRTEVFREYLFGVYQSYRFGALALFIVVIMLLYTSLFSATGIVITGIVLVGIIYLIRISRLFVIFMNRNISIFYLILYLCALEILPVVISVKYFTGLV